MGGGIGGGKGEREIKGVREREMERQCDMREEDGAIKGWEKRGRKRARERSGKPPQKREVSEERMIETSNQPLRRERRDAGGCCPGFGCYL